MLTGHMTNADVVVMNDGVWQGLSPKQKEAIAAASAEIRDRAAKAIEQNEAKDTQALREKGMTVIGPEQGLDVEAFRASVGKLVQERFGARYGALYEKIKALA
jgi:TRAP-type C4-dicarboxylate transport system substrate-binding protein